MYPPAEGGAIYQSEGISGIYPPAGVGRVPIGRRASNVPTCRVVECVPTGRGVVWGFFLMARYCVLYPYSGKGANPT